MFVVSRAAQPRLGAAAHQPALADPWHLRRAKPRRRSPQSRAKGYRAGYCPKIPLGDREKIKDVERAFAKQDVAIAEAGRWVNLLDSDPEKRRQNLATVTDGLALADAIGARCCVDNAGSFSTTSWFGPHPANLTPRFFAAAVENVRKIIDAVGPTRTVFTYDDDGVVAAGQPGCLFADDRGGGPQGVRLRSSPRARS